jgi:hypothetical protein
MKFKKKKSSSAASGDSALLAAKSCLGAWLALNGRRLATLDIIHITTAAHCVNATRKGFDQVHLFPRTMPRSCPTNFLAGISLLRNSGKSTPNKQKT